MIIIFQHPKNFEVVYAVMTNNKESIPHIRVIPTQGFKELTRYLEIYKKEGYIQL